METDDEGSDSGGYGGGIDWEARGPFSRLSVSPPPRGAVLFAAASASKVSRCRGREVWAQLADERRERRKERERVLKGMRRIPFEDWCRVRYKAGATRGVGGPVEAEVVPEAKTEEEKVTENVFGLLKGRYNLTARKSRLSMHHAGPMERGRVTVKFIAATLGKQGFVSAAQAVAAAKAAAGMAGE